LRISATNRRGSLGTLAGMRYRERLTVPLMWWVIAALFAVSLIAAVGFYLGPWWGLAAGLAYVAATAGLFATAAALITVDAFELRVGRARIEVSYLAGCRPLDGDQTRRRTGVDADARAYLVLRPYAPGAVEVTLDDADDPVPYWLISTRRPEAFAAAVGEAISSRVSG
jgi:hypothetical protein